MTHPNVKPAILGLDLGDRTSHLCALDDKRNVVERSRFAMTRVGVRKAFEGRPPTKIVLEAGAQSPWLAAMLTELGHKVLVVDPRRVALIAQGHRKTDRRDAEVLARLGLGMPELLGDVRHRAHEQQAAVAVLRSRDLLVRMRTRCVLHVRSTCKVFGERLRTCSASGFHRAAAEAIPELLRPALDSVLACLEALERQIRVLDRRLKELTSEKYPEAIALQQVNGVGPITSLAFVLTVADPSRFKRSREVGSWIGLAPRVRASGNRDPELSISKTGDAYLRRMLVQSAQYMLGPFGCDSDLRRFGLRLFARGGKGAKRRAVVAVARKLAVLLHRLWVSGQAYEPLRNTRPTPAQASA